MADISLKKNERLDDLERNGYRIIQNPDYFCFGMDAVLLSGYAHIPDGAKVLDLCCGNGIIPILLAAKTQAKHITGLEILPENVDMARRSIKLNGLSDRITIDEGDLKDATGRYGASSFDAITVNPPYMIADHGLKAQDRARSIARHEIECTLEDVLTQAAKLLKPQGVFYMVHRPFRLAEILSGMCAHGIEPKQMRMVHPFIDKEPTMVLIGGVRGGRSRMSVEKPLIIYEKQDVYTDEIREIYGF